MSPREWRKKLHIGTIAGIVVTGYIGFYLITTVLKNYELKKQIDTLQEEVSTLDAEKDTLKYKIQYYQTSFYSQKIHLLIIENINTLDIFCLQKV